MTQPRKEEGADATGEGTPRADAAGTRATLLQTLKAVGSGLFGVRSSKGHQADIARLNPIHVIIAAVLAAAVFIGVLLFVVRMMLRASGTA